LREGGRDSGPVEILTPGGSTTVTAATCHHDGEPALAWTSVGGKRVTFQGSFLLEPLAHLQFKEVAQCLALSATST
jgi:hypothetical protein